MPNDGISKESLDNSIIYWWSMKGFKMTELPLDPAAGVLRIANGEVAWLEIKPQNTLWNVAWHINHGDGRVTGEMLFSTADVRAAFGLQDDLARNYAYTETATVSYIGRFIRHGRCLNIPGPASGSPSPNISIWVTDELKSAVESFLKR